MPVSTCRRTTSATASRITRSSAAGSVTAPFSLANSTSVAACDRGRLPTWVVSIRSALRSTVAILPIGVVRGVVSREPALELGARLAALHHVDLRDVRVVAGELDDHAVGVGRVYRAAVTVLEHEGLRFLVASLLQSPLDAVLRLLVHVQRNVVKGRERHLRPELLLVLRFLELEE